MKLFSLSLIIQTLSSFYKQRFVNKSRTKSWNSLTENSLLQTNEWLHSFLNTTTDAVNITDSNGKVIYMNSSFEKMYGWTAEEFLGQPLPIIPESMKEKEWNQKKALLNGKSFSNLETQYMRKDGSLIDVTVTLTPIHDSNQTVKAFAAITRDASFRKKAESELREQESKYKLIAENSYDLIRLIDADGIVQYASPSHKVLLGFAPEELEGNPFDLIIHHEDLEKVRDEFYQNNFNPKPMVMEYRIMKKNRRYISVEAHTAHVLNEEGNLSHYIVVSRDVSEKKEHQKKLESIAYYDSLTGVPNRRFFQKKFEKTLLQASYNHSLVALLYLDFDRFKWVNDSMGHDVGDELLQLFVKRIQDCIRPCDVIGRLGGDEFVVILSSISSREEIQSITERLIHSLEQPWQIQEYEFITTSSIGISIYPTMALDVKSLISQADQALYRAKELGRNTFQFFTAEIEETSTRLLCLEEGLKRAVLNKEFKLVYQPQVNISTGETNCLETLLRYEHPKLGSISPSEFIPICERIGVMDELTIWIISEIGKQYQQWLKKGFQPPKISINVSPVSFKKDDFVRDFSCAIQESNIPPKCLELEITEQAIIDDLEKVGVKLTELKKSGITISLDDFGSGYSSLSYFRFLPIDKIKIDRIFLKDVHDNNKNKAIIQLIISLAEELNIEAVCEGIEKEEQILFLKQCRCQLGQGYYYYLPMPPFEIEKSGCMQLFIAKEHCGLEKII
jgi:diguanylate cyclase (GGDEF)-like protein/PAS domain S-box-containing protein